MWLHQAHIVILQHILLLLLIIQCHIKTYKFVSTIHNKFCAPTYTIRNVFEQPSHKLCKALRLRSLLVFHVGNNATTMTNSGAEPTRRPTEPTTRQSRAGSKPGEPNQQQLNQSTWRWRRRWVLGRVGGRLLVVGRQSAIGCRCRCRCRRRCTRAVAANFCK